MVEVLVISTSILLLFAQTIWIYLGADLWFNIVALAVFAFAVLLKERKETVWTNIFADATLCNLVDELFGNPEALDKWEYVIFTLIVLKHTWKYIKGFYIKLKQKYVIENEK